MKIAATEKSARAQLVLLLIAAATLFVLSFLPDARTVVSSSETRFSEISAHGLNIVPASCASVGPAAYHELLPSTADNQGYISQPTPLCRGTDCGDYGAFSPALEAALLGGGSNRGGSYGYFCINNYSSNTYFVPARTASELQTALNALKTFPNVAAYP